MHGVNGLHHITAIAGPAQENLDFYAGVLGMRLVKRSDLTFFPWAARRAPSLVRYGCLVAVDGFAPAGMGLGTVITAGSPAPGVVLL